MNNDILALADATGQLVRETKQQLRRENEALLQAVGTLVAEERGRTANTNGVRH